MIVVAVIEEELERLFMAQNGSPRQGGVSAHARIRISLVSTFDESFDQEEIVL
jgi:hypothetical protein